MSERAILPLSTIENSPDVFIPWLDPYFFRELKEQRAGAIRKMAPPGGEDRPWQLVDTLRDTCQDFLSKAPLKRLGDIPEEERHIALARAAAVSLVGFQGELGEHYFSRQVEDGAIILQGRMINLVAEHYYDTSYESARNAGWLSWQAANMLGPAGLWEVGLKVLAETQGDNFWDEKYISTLKNGAASALHVYNDLPVIKNWLMEGIDKAQFDRKFIGDLLKSSNRSMRELGMALGGELSRRGKADSQALVGRSILSKRAK